MRARCAGLFPAMLSLLIVGCVAGCDVSRGPNDDNPGGPGQPGPMGKLVLSPQNPVLNVDGKAPATLSFTVTRNGEDVTGRAALYLDDSKLGTFSGPTLTATAGAAGKTTVRARVDNDFGSTSLTLRVSAVVIAPGAPPDSPGKFGGPADPGRAPDLAYPPAGALIPPNLNELEVQWRPRGATLFEVAVSGEAIDLKIYTPCVTAGSGCGLVPDEPTWKLLSQAARGQTVKLSVRGSSPQGGGVGKSAEQKLSFGDDDIRGGLYYWAAAPGGIYRYDFGLRGQKAEPFYDAGKAGLVLCVGCHAMSRNGKRIAVGMNIPGPAQMRILDVATRGKLYETAGGVGMGGSDYESFTADGEKIVTTEGGGLTLRNAGTGALIGMSPAVPNADMPDVAPDSGLVVFARGSTPTCLVPGLLCVTLSVSGASLYTVPFTGEAFGAPQVLVPSGGANNYYPSFSPDSKFIVYNRCDKCPPAVPSGMGMNTPSSYDAADARVMVVPAKGGAPIDLKSANSVEGNSWPKWSPFMQHFQGASILWITFSTRRDYGLRPSAAAQLWMVPVDTGKLALGQDPGYPAVRLPFQNLSTGNHIAQWVESVERAPCSPLDSTGCTADEMCVDGKCIPILK